MGSRVFVDTSIILESILGKSSSSQDARNVLNRLRHYEVVIPQTVVAEGISQLITKSESSERLVNVQKFLEWIQILTDPNVCLPAANKEIYLLALELMSVENKIDLSDALIIAHALHDKNSQYLLTIESTVIESLGIDNKSSELVSEGRRNKKLEITDSV